MKNFLFLILTIFLIFSCTTTKFKKENSISEYENNQIKYWVGHEVIDKILVINFTIDDQKVKEAYMVLSVNNEEPYIYGYQRKVILEDNENYTFFWAFKGLEEGDILKISFVFIKDNIEYKIIDKPLIIIFHDNKTGYL